MTRECVNIMTSIYNWYGCDVRGRLRAGCVRAPSRLALDARLRACGISPLFVAVSWRSCCVPAWWRTFFSYSLVPRRLAIAVVGQVCKDVDALLAAGIPLHDALLTTAQTIPAARYVLRQAASRVAHGERLVMVFESQGVWPSVLCVAIRASEETGRLAHVLGHIGNAFVLQAQYRQQLRRALLVPLLTCSVAALVLSILFIYLMPLIMQLGEQGEEAVAGVRFSVWGQWCGGVGLGFVCAWFLVPIRIRHKTRYFVPIIGSARVLAQTLLTLRLFVVVLKAGVPLARALSVVHRVPLNKFWQAEYQKMQEQVVSGADRVAWVDAVDSVIMLPIVRRCFLQATSQDVLAHVCQYAAERVQAQLQHVLDVRLALLQPAAMALIGVSVGGFLYLMFEKMFAVFSGMGGM